MSICQSAEVALAALRERDAYPAVAKRMSTRTDAVTNFNEALKLCAELEADNARLKLLEAAVKMRGLKWSDADIEQLVKDTAHAGD